MQTYLGKQGCTMPFALDTDGSVIKAFGGSTAYPVTVVSDRTGKIVYNKAGSVAYEHSESLITSPK